MNKIKPIKISVFDWFVKTQDWKGLASAFQKIDVKWHQKEWREFINKIRRDTIEDIEDIIQDTLSGDTPKYFKELNNLYKKLEKLI